VNFKYLLLLSRCCCSRCLMHNWIIVLLFSHNELLMSWSSLLCCSSGSRHDKMHERFLLQKVVCLGCEGDNWVAWKFTDWLLGVSLWFCNWIFHSICLCLKITDLIILKFQIPTDRYFWSALNNILFHTRRITQTDNLQSTMYQRD
jgi:hypothetical protein